MATVAAQPQPLTKEDAPTTDELLADVPKTIEAAPFKAWNSGVFAQELLSLQLVQIIDGVASPEKPTEIVEEPKGQIEEGTWGGTQLALTDMYSRIERRYAI